jgi:hypothetical protein
MMLIDIQIARRLQLQIETTVLGEQFQHVVEKTNPSGNVITAPAFDL